MLIRIRYFASVRELMGTGATSIELPDGSTVADAFAVLANGNDRARTAFAHCLPMVNQDYVSTDHLLADGDELALIPPVSGGSPPLYRITEDPIDTAEVERFVAEPGAGAVVTFVGTVRNVARGRSVIRLDYEAYAPAAEKMLERIGDEMFEFWEVSQIAIVHRTGSLAVGEASVAIAVSSPHRAAAFDACRHAIERIKEIVPIWKKEWYEGGSVWIGSEADYQHEAAAESTA
ncbi:MAG: molybdenum cofactor biosynthesis protein MoaE [Thermomicrobiales bacterium]|nr:molybdenum cofactor biosynthesis protein MoaE [Thermomicrobiales bacterium]